MAPDDPDVDESPVLNNIAPESVVVALDATPDSNVTDPDVDDTPVATPDRM